ncbi:PAS domain S-box protein, partial [bacterium]|nr:PAS domain S-box protein [bacterium]
ISTIMRDISESRRIQESLRESEEKFRTIFEHAPFNIALTDMEGFCLDINEALCQAHGTVREKVIGRKMQENPDALMPADPDDSLRLGKKLAEQGWLKNEEVDLIRPGDGKRVPVIVSSRIITLGGKPAVLSMTVDVTERKHMEQQLAQAQKMEAVGLLAGGVAHDFNNLLQAILGYTELAMTGLKPGDPAYATMTEVQSAGRRAAELTRQLLAFSRRQVLRLEFLDLNGVIADLMKMLRRLIGEDIELVVMPGHELPGVSADRSQIEQVLMNLCINARDAMPHGGRLTIETEEVVLDEEYAKVNEWARPGRYVLLSVSDSGTGMDQATIEQIFDPFFTTKEKDRGTGLGLATVYG